MRKMLVLVGLAALLLAGCDSDTSSPTVAEKEAVSTGQMPVETRALLEENAADETDIDLSGVRLGFDDDLAAAAWENYDVFAVTIAWGDVYGQLGASVSSTDWAGTLSLESGPGLVDVRGVIDFERGQDSLIPVDSRHLVHWVSLTNRDIDGLAFLVFIEKTNTDVTAPFVRFTTAPFSLDMSRSDLKDFAQFFTIGDNKAVAVLSRQIWRTTCPGGFIKGEWARVNNTGDSGYFSGLWLDRNGEPVGMMTAQYRTLDNGDRVFEGSISGVMLTVVLGEVKGVWAYDDYRMCVTCGQGHGWFRGRVEWNSASSWPGLHGGFRGVFGDYGLAPEARVMPLRGAWRVDCPNTTDVVVPAED